MRGLIFSKYKLWKEDHIELQSLLDDYGYTCGYKLNVNELQLKDKFKYMYVETWDHVCSDSTEKLYTQQSLNQFVEYIVAKVKN